ncbi:hypothetical protein [Acidovorax sp. NCPPB 4044]|uniref:hypothetical protein n=1 Tax=Acidovorax sp. NCPPB 4044 TaxID=2940490 RepID=UPI002303ED2C|nr:hypothetical protein [Acidovorax sp. NCPPB 4044]MDA8519221.1 hypothetical protein [Acidovorax sp. NCPPB 4044]
MSVRRTALRAAAAAALVLSPLWAHAQGTDAAAPAQAIGPLARIDLKRPVKPIPGSDADCSGLVVDAKRIRHFWTHAVESTADNFQHGADLADCAAQAVLHLKAGTRGTLHLHDATGWGVLEWKGRTRYFFCASCEGILGRGFHESPLK